MSSRVALLALSVLALAPAASPAKDPGPAYPGAEWTEYTVTESDGTLLHLDVLRDKDVPLDAAHKQPVILSIGPYFNRSGQLGAAGPIADSSYEPVEASGPSPRFADLVNGAGLLEKGYTFVMADLRGYGGSSGCPDWGGPGEQNDVRTAVTWAATQPWSTGAVGTYGKSYDAMTGLMASGLRPPGLKAVIAQEPVYDAYRYLYGDGMRRANFAGTPALYQAIALTPGGAQDDPVYNAQGAAAVDPSKPGCNAQSVAEQSGNDDHYSQYWRARDFISMNKGSNVPVFLTQGLTEENTVADGLEQFLRYHTGPERGWFGPWEHVRGNERCGDGGSSTGCTGAFNAQRRLKMGRAGWYDEVLRFYDQYLRNGPDATLTDPAFAVQDNTGKWRAEAQWPPADTVRHTSDLNDGQYVDDGSGAVYGSGAAATKGVWTFSPALTTTAHLVGSPTVTTFARVDAPRSNLVVDVYDLTKSGSTWSGPLITRQAHLLREGNDVMLELWSADWKIAPGHRIAVRITDTNTDRWGNAVGARQKVDVFNGTISLPFLTYARPTTLPGDPGVQLAAYLGQKVTVPDSLVQEKTNTAFALPKALAAPPGAP